MTQLHSLHNHDGHINLQSGRKINLLDPAVEAINISDIALALSKIPHWGGHTHEFFSVAQHSVLVWTLAPLDHTQRMAALMHDAAEAYLGDVVKPLKIILGEPYAILEARFQAVIGFKYGIHPLALQLIKPFDTEALEIEFDYFFKGDCKRMNKIFGSEQPCWPPDVAMEMFLSTFHETFQK